MTDLLEQQLVNELRAILQPINDKYKDFFHIQLITLCDMKEMACAECVTSETQQQCRRCVIGFKEVEKDKPIPRILNCCFNWTTIPCDNPDCRKREWPKDEALL